ncbi:precorrin-6y C5,15-methyltransferase (decarboxylating) subunit CbiE [Streptomyces sp. NPDC021224]|uniref:precorrin-6y C5,15-methyltransferase (decarboxylating) subunit CbiE n=1 Tax=unclassified Streptomyces TaxID=2593676 RepID=UPI00379D0385
MTERATAREGAGAGTAGSGNDAHGAGDDPRATGAASGRGGRPEPLPPGPVAPGLVTVLGAGTGGAAPVVAGDAALVVGGARHLEAAELPAGARRLVLGPLAPALDVVAEYAAAGRRVVVLASGDPGHFGIVRALGERLGAAALDVRPSVPSVAAAFARVGLSWDDAVVVSAHGRALRTAVNVCLAHRKAAVLTGPGAGPAELGAALDRAGADRRLVVASRLGADGESVVTVSPREAARREWGGAVSVVLSLRPELPVRPAVTVAGPAPAPAGWALPEEAFAHRDSMISKFEVRALALARLGPRTGELVWDVGAGSGSVAVECARFGAAVVAVDRCADAVARVRANAAAHGVDVTAVHGAAPGVLGELPDPDAVFVGGGGEDVGAVVAACAARARRTVVVTLAAVERVAAVRAALGAAGFAADGVLLQSSRLAPLPGGVARLAAANPVFVLWAERRPGVRPGEEEGASA